MSSGDKERSIYWRGRRDVKVTATVRFRFNLYADCSQLPFNTSRFAPISWAADAVVYGTIEAPVAVDMSKNLLGKLVGVKTLQGIERYFNFLRSWEYEAHTRHTYIGQQFANKLITHVYIQYLWHVANILTSSYVANFVYAQLRTVYLWTSEKGKQI